VGIALLVVVAIGVAAPYLWLGLHPLSYVAKNALVLSGAVALVIWFLAEAKDHRRVGAGVPSAGRVP
jgi:hypothetical protein